MNDDAYFCYFTRIKCCKLQCWIWSRYKDTNFLIHDIVTGRKKGVGNMTSLSLKKEKEMWASAVAFFIYTKENFAKSLTLKK